MVQKKSAMQRWKQAGDGKLGCILWILLFAAATLVAVKMVPVRIQVGQLRDYMTEQAKFGGRNNDKLRKAIVHRAKELDIPLKADDVKINVSRQRARMEAKFVIPVEFPGYTYYWDFHLVLDEAKFEFN